MAAEHYQASAVPRQQAVPAQQAGRQPAERSAAEMSQLRHELARSHRAKSLGHLVDGIAHDFNNLLMVIESYASLVHEQVIGKPFSRTALLATVSRLLGTGVRGPDPE